MNTRITPLLDWLRSTPKETAEALFKSHGTSAAYVWQVAYGNKQPSGGKAVSIERATGISRKELRPNDWQHIWPELTEAAA